MGLAVIDLIEKTHPSESGERNVVQVGTICEGSWGSMDSLSCSILPEIAKIKIGLSVGKCSLNIAGFEAELSGNLTRPVGDKVILGGVLHGKHCFELAETEITVLVVEAHSWAASDAKIHEVAYEAVHFVGVSVIWQREGSESHKDLILNGAA